MIVSETEGLRTWLRLAPGVRVGRDDRLQLYLVSERRLALGIESAELSARLRRLSAGRQSGDEPETTDDCPGSPTLTELHEQGWVSATVEYTGVPLFTRLCLARSEATIHDVAGGTFVLSPLAVLHRQGEDLLLESATAASSVVIHSGPLLQLVGALSAPTPLEKLASEWPPQVCAAVLGRLVADGFVTVPPADGTTPEQDTGWSAHESWFHARSRWGRHASADYVGPYDDPSGRGGQPVQRLPYSGPRTALPRPDLDELAAADPSLTEVLERRTSVRSHDDERPITIAQLGGFLFRTARVRSAFEYKGVEYARRPYPGGGTAYELELYLAVGSVSGLDPGLYHYDPATHELVAVPAVAAAPAAAQQLLEQARNTVMTPNAPQVLVVISARFGRLMSKYRGMGYATMLKDVGVLYQTMYLVATAMGLAPCALGNGDTAIFAAATGTDFLQESSVGEFVLGSRAQQI